MFYCEFEICSTIFVRAVLFKLQLIWTVYFIASLLLIVDSLQNNIWGYCCCCCWISQSFKLCQHNHLRARQQRILKPQKIIAFHSANSNIKVRFNWTLHHTPRIRRTNFKVKLQTWHVFSGRIFQHLKKFMET